jgi:hypothetical protein
MDVVCIYIWIYICIYLEFRDVLSILYGFYMDFIWILYGFYMDLYGFIGISRDLKGFYMDLFMAYFWESFGS